MAKDKNIGSLALSSGNNVGLVAIYTNTSQKKQKIILSFAEVISKGILTDRDLFQLESELNSFVFISSINTSLNRSIEFILGKGYN